MSEALPLARTPKLTINYNSETAFWGPLPLPIRTQRERERTQERDFAIFGKEEGFLGFIVASEARCWSETAAETFRYDAVSTESAVSSLFS